MHVSLGGFVLFLHIGVAIVAFMMAAVLHAALHAMSRARSIAEMRSWTVMVHRLEPLLPISALLLVGLGAWLIHLEAADGVSWSDGWIVTAVVSLVIVEGLSGALIAPRSKALVARVNESADGPVPDDVRALTRNPVIWDLAHIATFGFLGVVFLMAAKPSGGWAPLFPIAGAVVGVALSRAQLRAVSRPAPVIAVPDPRSAAADVAAARDRSHS